MSVAGSLLLLLLAEIAAPTGNPQAKSKAQSLLKQGTALYTRGDFAAALERFEAAYRIYPSAKLQFNIGQADRELGRPLEAFQAFEKFLASSPDAAPEILAEARQSDTELRAKLGQVKIVSASAGVEVTLDGKSIGTTPIAAPLWTMPGPHEVALQRPGARPVSVDVLAGSEALASLDLPEPVAPSAAAVAIAVPVDTTRATPAPPPGWWARQRWYAWTAAGATVAFGAAAIGVGLSANHLYNQDLSSCASTGCSDAQKNTLKSRALLANVLWALTGVSAVATGIAVYVDGKDASVSLAWKF